MTHDEIGRVDERLGESQYLQQGKYLQALLSVLEAAHSRIATEYKKFQAINSICDCVMLLTKKEDLSPEEIVLMRQAVVEARKILAG